jgi:hypothetical protein
MHVPAAPAWREIGGPEPGRSMIPCRGSWQIRRAPPPERCDSAEI